MCVPFDRLRVTVVMLYANSNNLLTRSTTVTLSLRGPACRRAHEFYDMSSRPTARPVEGHMKFYNISLPPTAPYIASRIK